MACMEQRMEVVMSIRPEWPLRLGCGCVNLYAGFFLLTDPARFYKYVPVWLSRVASAVASVDAYLQTAGHRRAHDRHRPVGLVFPTLVCAPGINAAYGRNDAHSTLCWGRCGAVSQHRPSGGCALVSD